MPANDESAGAGSEGIQGFQGRVENLESEHSISGAQKDLVGSHRPEVDEIYQILLCGAATSLLIRDLPVQHLVSG